jgi:quinol monooxygenase YgiN
MLHVIATIEIATGKREDFLKAFHEIVPLVRSEEGCLAYGPAVDFTTNLPAQPPLRPNVVTVVEQWESLEHLEAHLIAPHMMSYRQKVKELVKGVTLQVLEPA